MKFRVKKREILVVDGYNVINAWSNLSEVSKQDLSSAREMLEDMIAEYIEYVCMEAYIVYDAYNVRAKEREEQKGRLHIIFTKENETADSYIERFIAQYKNKRHFDLKVVTDDMAEQQLVLGKGATRISTRELELDFQKSRMDIKKQIEKTHIEKNTIDDILDGEILQQLDNMRKKK